MVINTGTGEIDQLTSNQDNNYSPSIDSAGTHVAFQEDVGGFTQLFLATQISGSVGGITIPVDKLALLAPFFVIFVVAGSIGGTVFYARYKRRTFNPPDL